MNPAPDSRPRAPAPHAPIHRPPPRPPRFAPALVLLVLALQPPAAPACRYNVRDVGFVDLGGDPYRLVLRVTTPIAPDRLEALDAAAREILRDSNIRFDRVDAVTRPHPPFLQAPTSPSQPGDPPTPAVLVSPDGHSLDLHLDLDQPLPALVESWSATLRHLVESPTRTAVLESVTRAFGTLLFIEGSRSEANERARTILAEALEAIRGQMRSLPKAIPHPPEIIVLEPGALARETTLLWALHERAEPTPEPRVAIVYGRARWIGPVMRGPEISVRNLVGIFSIIGADCECGLDLAWTQGTLLPVRWTDALHAFTARALGFDPENPVVKSEIGWIVHRHSASPDASHPAPPPPPSVPADAPTPSPAELASSLPESPPLRHPMTSPGNPTPADADGPRGATVPWAAAILGATLVAIAGLGLAIRGARRQDRA